MQTDIYKMHRLLFVNMLDIIMQALKVFCADSIAHSDCGDTKCVTQLTFAEKPIISV